jgi:hypothetical protein
MTKPEKKKKKSNSTKDKNVRTKLEPPSEPSPSQDSAQPATQADEGDTESGSGSGGKFVARYRRPGSTIWETLDDDTAGALEGDTGADERRHETELARSALKATLRECLQTQHVVVLAGSGASLSTEPKGPSMWDLWAEATKGSEEDESVVAKVAKEVGIDLTAKEHQNIELFMSKMEAYMQVHDDDDVKGLLKDFRKVILDKCSYITPKTTLPHDDFLRRLARRRTKDERLKVFTTNYDLAFETAASRLKLVVLDGFAFTQPRQFDPRYFGYDIVRRADGTSSTNSYLEGVIVLHKLHGSVKWDEKEGGTIEQVVKPAPETACLVYPANGKFQKSFSQPYLESLSQFLNALRRPGTALVVVGFGFNDDHLSEPILAAIEATPHMRLIVVDRDAEKHVGSENDHWKRLHKLAERGYDIHLVADTFDSFVLRMPLLQALPPVDRQAQNHVSGDTSE